MTINCKDKILNLNSTIVMGILNVTPDSFFDGGKYFDKKTILKRAESIINEGATIIDIGGYSSRPGAKNISEEEELERVINPIKSIVKKFPEAIISIDTFRSKVAKKAIEAGASIINDISAGEMDSKMFETVRELQVPYIIMHMKGTPQNMQKNPKYKDITKEIIQGLGKKINELTKLGVNDIIIDPGFGFGKTIEHNYELLDNLELFSVLETPVLIGISRKSFIYKKHNTTPDNVLKETTELHKIGIQKGASILRVHDVKEAVGLVLNMEPT